MDRPSFEPYHKIPESSRAWLTDPSSARAIGRVPWVATEKIHGANFCLLMDDQGLRCAKRKAVLEPGEDFFGHRALLADLEPKARDLFRELRGRRPGLREARIYGELFGGAYPHDDVPAVPGLNPVQEGVYYCPSIRFALFDVVAVEAGAQYLSSKEALELGAKAGFLVTEPLFIGRFEEAMALPVRFITRWPAFFGLPILTAKNDAEGLVVKPYESLMLPGPKGLVRPLIKRKIAEFSEDARYTAGTKTLERFSGMREHALSILEAAMVPLINRNRLDAARSKLGQVNSARQRLELIEALRADVLLSLAEDYQEALEALPEDEDTLLKSLLDDEVQALVAAELSELPETTS